MIGGVRPCVWKARGDLVADAAEALIAAVEC
jgi:hypothetical protein